MRTALGALGLTAAQIRTFERTAGLDHLRPIASVFGPPALQELLQRLRYGPDLLTAPPNTHGRGLRCATGAAGAGAVLAPRTLLAIPGHFRELARRAPNETEAHALENLGWLHDGFAAR